MRGRPNIGKVTDNDYKESDAVTIAKGVIQKIGISKHILTNKTKGRI